jgi:hypothetical protein
MPTIKIDKQEYDLADLSKEAKSHLSMLQFIDQEIARLQMKMAVQKIARNNYLAALKDNLKKT